MSKEIVGTDALKEKYEEALFEILMDEYASRLGQQLIEENQRLNTEGGVCLPEGIEARCEKTIRQYFDVKKRKSAGASVLKGLSRAAIFLVVCGITFAILYNSVSAFRVTMWRLLRQDDAERINLSIIVDGQQSGEDGTIMIPPGSYLPTWLPDGYTLNTYEYKDETVVAVFSNKQGNRVMYLEYANSEVVGINTNADLVKDVSINGFEGVLVIIENTANIAWADTDRNRIIKIKGEGLDEETILKIAESVIKL
ncbi:MAG: DUF4367 domain-containing protein [Bacillota bacterium]